MTNEAGSNHFFLEQWEEGGKSGHITASNKRKRRRETHLFFTCTGTNTPAWAA